ncbi:tetratricopeptide repeat-containing sensor histidine kinase [Mucilaginibacter aquaedulcis]|uniref:tetratricopeptide repeat-containing sensor histidine kinase n=1 Tax=Mucilaginibacter aquaedulcis TaxID=1187081 RepID=UPI0025B5F35B|nr:sensor histidine kinase [Mucilaginibacter aquaedulcis]MDN3548087.1 sensor histidine kinase [Mucilaginibacter aquaedulcis]
MIDIACLNLLSLKKARAKTALNDGLISTSILLVFTLSMLAAHASVAQGSQQQASAEEVVRKYSTAQKRLLAINTAIFINEITQSHLDADSVQMVASRITGQPFLLPYTDRIEGDDFLATALLINNNKIDDAKKLTKQLKGEAQIRSIVDLAIWYLHQPKTFQSDLDSAENYIQQATNLSSSLNLKSWQEETRLIMGEIEFQRGNIDKSRYLFSGIITPATKGSETAVVAAALRDYSETFNLRDTARLQYLNRSVDIYHRLHQVDNEIVLRWLIADYYMTNNRNFAKNQFQQILDLQRSSGFRHELFTLYLLSIVYNNNSNFSDALKSAYAGLENMKWSGFNQFIGSFYMRIGVVYAFVDRLELAIPWYRKGMETKSEETHFFWYKSFLYLAEAYTDIGKPKECLQLIDSTVSKYPPKTTWENVQVVSTLGYCYERMNKIKLADLSYRKILRITKNYNDTYGELSDTYVDCAMFFIKLKNNILARYFLIKVNPKSKRTINYRQTKYHLLYKIDSLEGNFKAALQDHILYKQAYDSVGNFNEQQKLNELTVKYAAAKKDQDIKLLQEQQRVSKLMMIAGVGLCVLLLAVVIYRYHLKQRANDQIARKNEILQHLLTEKEWLLKEVHHRVKNNLHTVICLLESQARYLENDALAAVESSQHRIFAMSLIHQKLYLSEDIKTIDMATYIPELVQSLEDSFDASGQIRFKLNIEPINLSLSHAIPLGLIINEAVTNSIKYAFPDNRKGLITISMIHNAKKIKLELSDDGIGMPQIAADVEPESLGLRLIKGLSEDIDADITFTTDNGTKIIIIFKTDLLNNPDSLLKPTEITEVYT